MSVQRRSDRLQTLAALPLDKRRRTSKLHSARRGLSNMLLPPNMFPLLLSLSALPEQRRHIA